MSASNVDAVREAYAAFARGEVPAVMSFLDPVIEWTEAEGFPYGGTYVGPTAVLQGVFMRLATEWTPFRVEPNEYIDGGDQVVVLGIYSGTYGATGKSFRAHFAHVWTLRGGKAVRFMQYVDSHLVQQALQP